jgi:hypothetical protein
MKHKQRNSPVLFTVLSRAFQLHNNAIIKIHIEEGPYWVQPGVTHQEQAVSV